MHRIKDKENVNTRIQRYFFRVCRTINSINLVNAEALSDGLAGVNGNFNNNYIRQFIKKIYKFSWKKAYFDNIAITIILINKHGKSNILLPFLFLMFKLQFL